MKCSSDQMATRIQLGIIEYYRNLEHPLES